MGGIRLYHLAVMLAVLCACTPSGAATLEELTQRIERLEKENQTLRQRMQQIDSMANATADALEAVATVSSDQSDKQTHLGGYGELHYNSLNGDTDKDEIDFHRFVLFLNHDFTDRISFYSELELEHSIAGDGQPGEVELEQAYLDFGLSEHMNLRAGLFLLPIGILNETHEPPTFYGVERNPIEKSIIPTTWWESGVGIYGEIVPGVSYDLHVHSGLKTSGNLYPIRGGRQKSAKAAADNLAATAGIRWYGLPGLDLGVSYQHQDDITQGEDASAGEAGLIVVNSRWKRGPFGLKALYARWDLDGSGPEATGADTQEGYCIEPSFSLLPRLGAFVRFNRWDNQAGGSGNTGKEQWDVGINYYPHPSVVVKADYQHQDNENDKNQRGINIGVGYQF